MSSPFFLLIFLVLEIGNKCRKGKKMRVLIVTDLEGVRGSDGTDRSACPPDCGDFRTGPRYLRILNQGRGQDSQET